MYGDLLRKKLGNKPYLVDLYEKAGVLTNTDTRQIELSLDDDWYKFEFQAPKKKVNAFGNSKR